MRHRKKKLQFNASYAHRDADFRNLLTSLFLYKRIKVSKVKAKKLRVLFDNIVSRAIRSTDFNAIRLLNEKLYTKEAKIKAMDLIAHFKETKRISWFTRIVGFGFRRGDNSEISLIEIVE